MALLSVPEIVRSLYGTWLFARRASNAHQLFEDTPTAFWRSFQAAVISAPAYVVVLYIGFESRQADAFDLANLARHLAIYGIAWLAWPLMVWRILESVDRTDNFVRYMVPYNWAAVPISWFIAVIALILASGTLPGGLGTLVFVASYGAVLIFVWEITRRCLSVTGQVAAGIVAFDVVFTAAVRMILDHATRASSG